MIMIMIIMTMTMLIMLMVLIMLMYLFLSGFTSLCETYGNLAKSDVKSCGTEKLTATLNTYIGKIVEGEPCVLPYHASGRIKMYFRTKSMLSCLVGLSS